ncbi:MAG: hypothetical protein K0S56_924 [Microvirga sp.]|jgi:hypothetical protein|nr:hypothetical protein [Microvirga sp.]
MSALKRKILRSLARNESVVDADRRFFSRRPDRLFRVRVASAAEVETASLAGMTPDDGERLFCVIKHISSVVRMRAFFTAPAALAGCAEDVSDVEAAQIYAGMGCLSAVERLARKHLAEGGDAG